MLGHPHVLLVTTFGEPAARLGRLVRDLGFRVTRLGLGEDALLALKSGAFDVLLLDSDLPDMTGGELMARKAREPGVAPIPTILAWEDDGEVELCSALSSANAVARLRLPIDSHALAGALRVAVTCPEDCRARPGTSAGSRHPEASPPSPSRR